MLKMFSPRQLTQHEIVRLSYMDGLCFALMVCLSESMIVAYLSKIKLNQTTFGILTTLPPAIGAFIQIFSAYGCRKMTCSRVTFGSIIIQMLGLFVISMTMMMSSLDLKLIGLGLTLYWVGGMTAGPAWQSWIVQLLPEDKTTHFFARRTSIVNSVTLIFYLASGFILGNLLTQNLLAWLVLVALIFRLFSFLLLYSHPRMDLKNETTECSVVSKNSLDVLMSGQKNWLKILIPLCSLEFLFRISVTISSPFFSPYLIQELQFSIPGYFLINSIPLLTRVIFLENWARLLNQSRLFEGLVISLLGISSLPILWNFASSSGYLSMMQALNGIFWSGLELINIILIQRLFPKNLMMAGACYAGSGALGLAVGGWLGGMLLQQNMGYHFLFSLSSVSRLVCAVALIVFFRSQGAFTFRALKVKLGVGTILSVRTSLDTVGRLLLVPARRGKQVGVRLLIKRNKKAA